MGSMLSPNCVIAKDDTSCTYCYYVIFDTLIVWVWWNALAKNRSNSVPCTVGTSRQKSCNQRVGCLQWLGSRLLSTDPPEVYMILLLVDIIDTILPFDLCQFIYNLNLHLSCDTFSFILIKIFFIRILPKLLFYIFLI